MATELVLCPACGTKNAAYRFACLKCGVELFDPTGADLTTGEESKLAKRPDLWGWLTNEKFLPPRIQKGGDFLACMFYSLIVRPIQVVVGLGLSIGGWWIGRSLLDDWYGLSAKSSTPFGQLTPNDLVGMLIGSVLLIVNILGWGWVCLHIAAYNLCPWVKCSNCGEINRAYPGYLNGIHWPESCSNCDQNLKDVPAGIWRYIS